jgi:uncharacterized protein DUF3300
MSLFSRSIIFLKYTILALTLSTTVFFAGSKIIPGVDAYAANVDVVAAAESNSVKLLTPEQLTELVGSIALYADELIAIVLPASTFPIQIVQAARYLEKYKQDSTLQPDKNWDGSVLGLLNYPEVIEKMNGNLEWTWKLGEAVVNQQNDVMEAIQQFRNTAYTAGNLNSDEKTIIIQEEQIIKIESATPEVIYVPSYNPATVIVQQPAPYPYYYSAPYPYYYNPAAVFWTGMFVGAAISYGLGWHHHGHHDINVNRNTNISVGDRNIGGGDRNIGDRRGGDRNIGDRRGGSEKWSSNRKGGSVGRPGGTRPVAGTRPNTGSRTNLGSRPGSRPSTGQKLGGSTKRPSTGQKLGGSTKRPSTGSMKRPSTQPYRTRTGQSGSFGNYSRGRDAVRNSQRGMQSRSSQTRSRSSRSSMSRSGGGRTRSGGGRRR